MGPAGPQPVCKARQLSPSQHEGPRWEYQNLPGRWEGLEQTGPYQTRLCPSRQAGLCYIWRRSSVCATLGGRGRRQPQLGDPSPCPAPACTEHRRLHPPGPRRVRVSMLLRVGEGRRRPGFQKAVVAGRQGRQEGWDTLQFRGWATEGGLHSVGPAGDPQEVRSRGNALCT